MPPNAELEAWRVSGISRTYPTHRKRLPITEERCVSSGPIEWVEFRVCFTLSWLRGKQTDDGAEGLWRIRDKLYNLTDFAQRHPGGSFWIECTKGTDITEPFESHHIEEHASRMLSQFEVRQAASPRNYQFTLEETGFYMTLKRRVRQKLRSLNYRPSRKTDVRGSPSNCNISSSPLISLSF